MHPLVRAAVVVAALAAVSAAARGQDRSVKVRRRGTSQREAMSAVCPAGTLPDFDQCVTIPEEVATGSASELTGVQNVHRDRSGRWTTCEQIPRMPDRP